MYFVIMYVPHVADQRGNLIRHIVDIREDDKSTHQGKRTPIERQLTGKKVA
jgi:hypothetical protein